MFKRELLLAPHTREAAVIYPQFEDISSAAWEHPADAAALKALRALPGLDSMIRRTFGRLNEAANRGRMVKGRAPTTWEKQPRLWGLYKDVIDTFDVPEPWPLYVVPMGGINAGAVGMESPFLILSEESTVLDDAALRVILAHEVGHLLSGHVLYRTMMRLLMSMSWMALSAPASLPVVIGGLITFVEWERKSELSADRASALAMGGADDVLRVLEGVEQGRQEGMKDQLGRFKDKLSAANRRRLRVGLEALEKVVSQHPPIEERLEAVSSWVESEEFISIYAGDYPRRGEQVPWDGAAALDSLRTRATDLSDRAGSAVMWLRARAGLGH